jgi:aspartate semialdehyde dehydrogenase (EC 1.2.1.11)
MQRMREERDFDLIEPVFFTTSQVGGKGPDIGRDIPALKDARNIDELKDDGRYHFHPGRRLHHGDLRPIACAGWKGYWIDAASRYAWKRIA